MMGNVSYHSYEMDGIIDDLVQSAEDAFNHAVEKGKEEIQNTINSGIAKFGSGIITSPSVQQQIQDEAKQKAIDATAQKLHAGSNWMYQNRNALMIAGGVGLGLIAMSLLMRK
jgi:hypothetical protein